MRESNASVTPKTQKAAYNRAATLMIQLEDQQRKRRNLMSSQGQVQDKIKELTAQLTDMGLQAQKLEASEQVTQRQIDELAAAHTLTQIELAETKSQLLTKQITRLQKMGKQ